MNLKVDLDASFHLWWILLQLTPERLKRFDIIYHCLSMYQNRRIRLRVSLRDHMIASIVDIHPS